MRVFVTGATGFIGTAVVRELITAGHRVLGLARSDGAAEALARAGADVQRGELGDHASLASAARACDGVIHLAFIHDFSAYVAATETDRHAIDALVHALEGSGKPLVITSGSAGTVPSTPGRVSTEADAASPEKAGPRAASEVLALAAADRGVRVSVVRLPPSVHGAGDHGFVPGLIGVARRTGVAGYLGDGANRWPAVHRLDAARLYRLVLEKAEPGTRWHGIAEEGVPMRAIAGLIGEGLGLPVRSITADEAPTHFDWMARFVGLDNPTSSVVTRETLGWRPEGPDLLTDMRESGYFA